MACNPRPSPLSTPSPSAYFVLCRSSTPSVPSRATFPFSPAPAIPSALRMASTSAFAPPPPPRPPALFFSYTDRTPLRCRAARPSPRAHLHHNRKEPARDPSPRGVKGDTSRRTGEAVEEQIFRCRQFDATPNAQCASSSLATNGDSICTSAFSRSFAVRSQGRCGAQIERSRETNRLSAVGKSTPPAIRLLQSRNKERSFASLLSRDPPPCGVKGYAPSPTQREKQRKNRLSSAYSAAFKSTPPKGLYAVGILIPLV
jgi:hypothetical protein